MDARSRNNLVKSLPMVIAALCCVTAAATGEEKTPSQTAPVTSPAATSSTTFSVPKTRLQWQPLRPTVSSNNAPLVRTVRYEQDVFADGPALQATEKTSDKTAVKRAALNQTSPKSPFEEPETPPMPTPTPVPEHTLPPMPTPTPMETMPTPMPAPTETTPPLEFRPPSTPTPAPDTTIPPRELEPPTTTPPSTMFPPPSSTIDQFDMGSRERPRYDPAQDCETAYAKLRQNTIDKLSVSIKVAGEAGTDIPFECSLSDDPFDPRCWKLTTFTWKASALCHKPVYFEEVHLERYGHSHGPVCEYLVSAAHFFGNVALLPYHMGVETPTECVYTLGYYRPGNCAPYMIDPFPVSLRGAAFGAVGYCGTVALFP